MKIAFLCNNFKSQNGVERVWSQKLSLLAEHPDFDVFLITYNQYGAPFSFPISDKVHHIDLATRYISRCSFHGIYQYIDRYKSERSFRKKLDTLFNKLDPNIITCADLHVSDLKAILSSTVHAVRVVECHCGRSAYFEDIHKHNHFQKRLQDILLKRQLISAIRKFDKMVVMTETEKADWDLNDKVICIPNMLVTSPDHESKTHPDWSLHIYGSHDGGVGDYERLQDQIKQNQIGNVFLHQFTNDVYASYAQSDFYVMSSRFESFGLVLIEAMSCGLPVISFDCKYGPPSIIQNGNTGLLVPQGNTKELTAAICSMIEHDEERQQMAINAKVESKKYQPENVMPIWCDFYKSLVANHPIDA